MGWCRVTGVGGTHLDKLLGDFAMEKERWLRIRVVCVLSQSRLILCDPMDYSPPGSSVLGISQARILE